jgi:DNA-binding transcriptional LysR family regulator
MPASRRAWRRKHASHPPSWGWSPPGSACRSCEHIHIDGVSYVPLTDPAAMSEIHVAWRRDERAPLVAQFVRLLSGSLPKTPA